MTTSSKPAKVVLSNSHEMDCTNNHRHRRSALSQVEHNRSKLRPVRGLRDLSRFRLHGFAQESSGTIHASTGIKEAAPAQRLMNGGEVKDVAIANPQTRFFVEILGEARFLGEYLRFRGDKALDREQTSNPDWRPVLLIPGFMAGDASLYPLGSRLRAQRHRVFYAGIWMNADCPAKTLERLRKRIHEVSLQSGRKIAIIGHSLGGIYARELARMEPGLVEQVFLLGSPVKHALGNTTPYLRPLVAAMRFMHAHCMEDVSAPCKTCGLDLPETAPEVPETCIYTKSDGIVEWHSCIDEGPQVECVEIDSSHCGIPLNPSACRRSARASAARCRRRTRSIPLQPRHAHARWRPARLIERGERI